jgi:hypothetical protein
VTLPTPIRPVHVQEDFVLRKCAYFVEVQLWPRTVHIDPARWLANFNSAERDHAVHLLNAFLYFSNDLVKELLRAAFQSLSADVVPFGGPFVQADATWQAFRRSVLVTHVTGETPSDTDSGYLFKRLARQELGIPEANILPPDRALSLLLARGPRPLLFVDDFVGSGDQFVTSWRRELVLPNGRTLSFDGYSQLCRTQFFYCPLICTTRGHDTIAATCPAVSLRPAHVLPAQYNVLDQDSLIWPDHLRPDAARFITMASARAGIPGPVTFGYKNLGLCLAFEHCVPDATLPLFYHDLNGWNPLVRRK